MKLTEFPVPSVNAYRETEKTYMAIFPRKLNFYAIINILRSHYDFLNVIIYSF